ncbi:MAG: hydroxymethylbilane synthase [Bauldia sp.]|nr:hydroxymethylbilane synthase [Bauldia sp.]
MQTPLLRLGTRGSPLALAQAHEIAGRLADAHGFDRSEVEIVVIKTTGDAVTDRPLSDVGGKGLFTKELEDALLDRRIDLAVHSSKDMPTVLPAGLDLAAFPPREDVRDAFLSGKAKTLAELPEGAVLGTSSLRRKAMALMARPDLRVVEFRGNVATRMRKLEEGVADATLLAMAGLNRLGLRSHVASVIEVWDFLPAVGQGAIGVETRTDDLRVRELLAPVNDPATATALHAERAFLATLDGSCRTPIGGLAVLRGAEVHFEGIIVSPDGTRSHRAARTGAIADAAELGRDAGAELARRGGPNFFSGG